MRKFFLSALLCASLFGASENLVCDLNKQDCEVFYNGTKVVFSFYPKPLSAMAPLSFRVSGLAGNFEDLNVKIYGVSMDMGTSVTPLEKRGNDYVANVTLHSCVMPVMRWRAELFDKEKPLNLHIDFDLKN